MTPSSVLRAKLRALVRAHEGTEPGRDLPDAPAGTMALEESTGCVWVLIASEPARTLGPTLWWLDRRDVWSRSSILLDEAGSAPAVLAALDPGPRLGTVRAREVRDVSLPDLERAAEFVPELLGFDVDAFLDSLDGEAREISERVLGAVADMEVDALEVDGDDVVLTVRGLEVARLGREAGEWRLHVGVGVHDREVLRAGRVTEPGAGDPVADDLADLARAVATVLEHRRAGGVPHPLGRLQGSQWLRSLVMADPSRADLAPDLRLQPVSPGRSTGSLRERVPAVAVGPGEVVVCSRGIDPSLVPRAIEAWLAASRHAGTRRRLTVVVAPRDAHPLTQDLLTRTRPDLRARLATIGVD